MTPYVLMMPNSSPLHRNEAANTIHARTPPSGGVSGVAAAGLLASASPADPVMALVVGDVLAEAELVVAGGAVRAVRCSAAQWHEHDGVAQRCEPGFGLADTERGAHRPALRGSDGALPGPPRHARLGAARCGCVGRPLSRLLRLLHSARLERNGQPPAGPARAS